MEGYLVLSSSVSFSFYLLFYPIPNGKPFLFQFFLALVIYIWFFSPTFCCQLKYKIMWVSVFQNGRKKDSDLSISKINQYLKIADKSSYSPALNKPTSMSSSRLDEKREYGKDKQNHSFGSARITAKNRANISAANMLANRNSILSPYFNTNVSQDSQQSKKPLHRFFQEHTLILTKTKKNLDYLAEYQNVDDNGKQEKKTAYFFRILQKKNKLRSEFNINIHNSIYTFKQFLKICQFAHPKNVDLKIPPEKQNRKTIVFDMDQTLIHTNETMIPNYQIKVPFRSFQGRVGYGYVEVRPFCKEILKRLSQHFDIILFTASTQAYADPIIDHIDPDKVIQHRLYRESCTLIKNQIFVKDLRVLGRSLVNTVLVDNAPYSYLMQLENGVPIIPYYRGREDEQLLSLENYLMKLKDVEDVRTINRDYFKLHEYIKFDTYEKLIQKLYGEWATK